MATWIATLRWHAGVHAAAVADGLVRVSQVIWDKGLFAIGRSWYHWSHEPCWVVRKAGSKAKFLGPRDQATTWRAPSPKMIMSGSSEAKEDHPTQKPLVLFETPIRNHLKPGGDVYEPFSGSGTCLIAAERTATRCYAMEIDRSTSRLPCGAGSALAETSWCGSMGERRGTVRASVGLHTEELDRR